MSAFFHLVSNSSFKQLHLIDGNEITFETLAAGESVLPYASSLPSSPSPLSHGHHEHDTSLGVSGQRNRWRDTATEALGFVRRREAWEDSEMCICTRQHVGVIGKR